jgi:formamidopyrimidine-DNA glycosylase
VLEQGLKHRGVSFYTYRDARGERGQAQDHLLCYGRAGEPCRSCGEGIRAVKVGGRGTAYCPKCQK